MDIPQLSRLQALPPRIRSFLIRAFLCFLVWQVAYQAFLKPERHLDRHVTDLTAYSTASVLTRFYGPTTILQDPPRAVVVVNGARTIGIADGCNALELFILYLAFLICMPASNMRRLVFAFIGVPSIFLLNILRCCGIAWLHMHHPQMVDFAHHYVFAVIVYAFIFYMLTLFSRNLQAKELVPDQGES